MLTTLLGGGMLLSDMKGFNLKLPNLETLRRLLPQHAEEDYDEAPAGFSSYAGMDERVPVHHDLLPSERAPAFVVDAPPPPPVRTVRIDNDPEPELTPGTYDSHQPNLDRADLEEPDPEIDAVVASLAVEDISAVDQAQIGQSAPEAATDENVNDLMSFFEDMAEVSKVPTTLTENLPSVSTSELLSEVRELRALLQGRRDAA